MGAAVLGLLVRRSQPWTWTRGQTASPSSTPTSGLARPCLLASPAHGSQLEHASQLSSKELRRAPAVSADTPKMNAHADVVSSHVQMLRSVNCSWVGHHFTCHDPLTTPRRAQQSRLSRPWTNAARGSPCRGAARGLCSSLAEPVWSSVTMLAVSTWRQQNLMGLLPCDEVYRKHGMS